MKRFGVWTRVTADTDTFDYLYRGATAEDAQMIIELFDRYKDDDLTQIDSDEDRDFIMDFISLPEYYDNVSLEQIEVFEIRKVSEDELRQAIVDGHNEKVEKTLSVLD